VCVCLFVGPPHSQRALFASHLSALFIIKETTYLLGGFTSYEEVELVPPPPVYEMFTIYVLQGR